MIDPHPVIPQSREQAAQRDNRHQLDTRPPETPEGQVADFCRDCWLTLHKTTRPDGDPAGTVCSVCRAPAILRAEVWR